MGKVNPGQNIHILEPNKDVKKSLLYSLLIKKRYYSLQKQLKCKQMFNLFNTVYKEILYNLSKIDKQVLKMIHIVSS